jgi:hypothetical protein
LPTFARAALLVLVLVAAGCTHGDDHALEQYSDEGLTLAHPTGWSVTGFSMTNDPHRLALASYDGPADSVEGDCGGLEAVRRLPRSGALVVLIDYGTRTSFPPLPNELELSSGTFTEHECLGLSTMFQFRADGRNLQAPLAFGADASAERKREALAVIRSVEAQPG